MQQKTDSGAHDNTQVNTILGKTTIQELLEANTILLSFAIDPHGKWGPITQNFLTNQQTQIESPKFPPHRPNAKIMYERSTSFPCPTGILQTANISWNINKTRQFFGHSHTAPTPSIATIQQLGLGITETFSLHLWNSQNHLLCQEHTDQTNNNTEDDATDNDSIYSYAI